MTTDRSLLAEEMTLTIESLAGAVEAEVVGKEEAPLLSVYKTLRYAAGILGDTLKPYTQTFEEAAREVEQYGTSTNAGGVR